MLLIDVLELDRLFAVGVVGVVTVLCKLALLEFRLAMLLLFNLVTDDDIDLTDVGVVTDFGSSTVFGELKSNESRDLKTQNIRKKVFFFDD